MSTGASVCMYMCLRAWACAHTSVCAHVLVHIHASRGESAATGGIMIKQRNNKNADDF